jgi:DNA-binding response OmpR family regulator
MSGQEQLLYIGKVATDQEILRTLEEQGYRLTQVAGLRPALRALANGESDLILIDTMATSLVNLHRLIHAAMSKVSAPFIILLTSDHSRIAGLGGYDESLTRPFTARRLLNLVHKLLRSRREYVITMGPLSLDRRTRCVRSPRGVCLLPPKQFQILDYLMEHPGEIISRRQFMQTIWNTAYLGDTRTLDVHIRWLRQCIEPDPEHPQFIRTVRGRGYFLAVEGVPEVGGEPIIPSRVGATAREGTTPASGKGKDAALA